MENILNKIIEENRRYTSLGRVAEYIPALKEANPNHIGACLIDLENNIYKAGDYSKKFTIQSISKLISLVQAIEDRGRSGVFEKVGYEGTDEPFNSFISLDLPHIKKPANPMINSGAIVTTSLIKGDRDQKFEKILSLTRSMAKNPNINYNKKVYLSERESGDRNRAIAYLMKSKGMIQGNVDEILDVYFKQCSIEIDTVDLARIGHTIASSFQGIDLKEICKKELTSLIISIMGTCGMYNFSGQYMAEVGLPSKSGVSGGIMGLVPSRMGIGVYSPALDERGNSFVGYRIMKDLVSRVNLTTW